MIYATRHAAITLTALEIPSVAEANAWPAIPAITWEPTANAILNTIAIQATFWETITCAIPSAAITPIASRASVAVANA